MPLDVNQAYSNWQTAPDKHTLSAVVQALEPTINYALGAANAQDHPVVRSKAQLYAAEAIEKFDPKNSAGATLPTFVTSHLRQLSRASRLSKSPVKMPEKIMLDAWHLEKKTREFQDMHNREPDAVELADFSGLPVHRIAHVRQHQRITPSESAGVGQGEMYQPEFDAEALANVHENSDHLDRRVLELKTGFGGSPVMDPQAIGLKLGLTPSQLSRRSMRLAQRINAQQSNLEAL